MQNYNSKHTELANNFAGVGAALLDLTGTAAALAAIPDTEPQQYVAAGTPENIAAILPATISPARRMRHGERPTEALVFDEPAATSGDAPDLQQLKALAEQVKGWANVKHVWRDSGDEAYIVGHINEDGEKYPVVVVDTQQYYEDGPALANFYAAANPAVVLGLIARIDRAERALIRAGFVDHGAQEWKPPVGPAPRFIEVPAAPATASGDELADFERAWPGIHKHGFDGGWRGVALAAWQARAAVSAATKPTDPAKAE